MNVAEALLAKNLIPILHHDNDTYSMIEVEGRRAATGLCRKRRNATVHVAVVHSVQSNAHTFRAGEDYVIAVTDTLLQRLEEAITGYLDAPQVQQFIPTTLGIAYASATPWPTGMTWGGNPDSRRAAIANDTRIALFYEIMDAAWFFCVLHEAAHINTGDVDGDRERPDTLYAMVAQTADLLSYGGDDWNKHARFAEFDADRNAAGWLMQIILSKYVEALPRPDPFGLAHVVLATFGMMAAVLLIAHHEPDTVEAMAAENHPSFEIRLVGVGEGIEAVLTKLKGPLDMPVTYKVLYAISQLRRAMETVVLGAPSKYMISL